MKNKIQLAKVFLITLPFVFACGGRDNPPTVVVQAPAPAPAPVQPQQQQGNSSDKTPQKTGDVSSTDKTPIFDEPDSNQKNQSASSENSQNQAQAQTQQKEGKQSDLLTPLPEEIPGSGTLSSSAAAPATAPTTQASDSGLTPAVLEAEKAALASPSERKGVQPPGSKIAYTQADGYRIENYRHFLRGDQSVDNIVQSFFKDRNFNRSVEVMGDLYHQDRLAGNISPEMEKKFQDLGLRVGNSVLIYNQRQSSSFKSNVKGAVIFGTLLGAVAGMTLVKDEWVPEWISTRFGPRIPGVVRNGIITGVASGGTILVSMGAYRAVSDWVYPDRIYNADPLLDTPSKK